MTEPQQDDPRLEVQQSEDVQKHPLVVWAGLAPGDVVSIRGLSSRDWVGTVESRSSDGLVIWIRDVHKVRRSFHFRECQSVRVIL